MKTVRSSTDLPRGEGSLGLVPPQINDDFSAILEWADEIRRLKVRTNADTPEDAAKAVEQGLVERLHSH